MHYKLSVPLSLHLGVPTAERAKPQEICVIVEFEADTTTAEQSDRIEDCPVNYQMIHDLIQLFGEDEVQLLEHLHRQIITQLEQQFPQVETWKVTLFKTPWERGYIEIS